MYIIFHGYNNNILQRYIISQNVVATHPFNFFDKTHFANNPFNYTALRRTVLRITTFCFLIVT